MASYNPPNPYVPGVFNPTQFITPSANITTQYLSENYLKFPFAQGAENFVSINNLGALSQGGQAVFSSTTTPAIFTEPPTITTPVVYPAATPSAAMATIKYVNDAVGGAGGGNVSTNISNTYDAGTTQTFTNTSLSNPIEILNTAGGFVYLSSGNPGGLNIYSSGTGAGSSSGISITNGLQQQTVIYPTTGGTQLVGALLVGGSITTTTQIKCSTLIGTGSLSSPTYYLKTDTANYGNFTGSNNGITSSVNMYVPTQTYISGTTYGNIASTQSFVQQALSSQGGGDAYLGAVQTFTAANTFTGGCNITNNATCGTSNVNIVSNPYEIVNNTMLIGYAPGLAESNTFTGTNTFSNYNPTITTTELALTNYTTSIPTTKWSQDMTNTYFTTRQSSSPIVTSPNGAGCTIATATGYSFAVAITQIPAYGGGFVGTYASQYFQWLTQSTKFMFNIPSQYSSPTVSWNFSTPWTYIQNDGNYSINNNYASVYNTSNGLILTGNVTLTISYQTISLIYTVNNVFTNFPAGTYVCNTLGASGFFSPIG